MVVHPSHVLVGPASLLSPSAPINLRSLTCETESVYDDADSYLRIVARTDVLLLLFEKLRDSHRTPYVGDAVPSEGGSAVAGALHSCE